MTREEAIQALKDLADMNVRYGCDDKWIMALHMAIEALSAKPQTDLISREKAIDARPEYRNEDMIDKEKATYNKGWNDCTDAWRAIIKALPSADTIPIIPMEIKKQFQIDNPEDYEPKIIGNAKYVRSKCEVTDLISRADALRELNGACSNWQDDAKVAEIINALPSAEAEDGTIYYVGKKYGE